MDLDTTNFHIFKIWTPQMQEHGPATGTGSEIPEESRGCRIIFLGNLESNCASGAKKKVTRLTAVFEMVKNVTFAGKSTLQ